MFWPRNMVRLTCQEAEIKLLDRATTVELRVTMVVSLFSAAISLACAWRIFAS